MHSLAIVEGSFIVTKILVSQSLHPSRTFVDFFGKVGVQRLFLVTVLFLSLSHLMHSKLIKQTFADLVCVLNRIIVNFNSVRF